MELSNDQIINIGLNMVGFLAAGGLMMLIAGAFRNRNRTAVVVSETRPASESKLNNQSAPPRANQKAPTFVPLTGNDESMPIDNDRRRNRARILELARQMINDGQSDERIVDLLPISQAELAVLKTTDSDSTGSK